MVTVDRKHGLLSPSQLLTTSTSDTKAIALSQEQLVSILAGSLLANYWPIAADRDVTPADDLSATDEEFRHAVFQIALQLATDTPLEVMVTGSPVGGRDLPSTLTGEGVDVSQSRVRPATSTVPIENAFEIDVDGERYAIGGAGAFLEDFEAASVTIRPLET